MRTTDHRRLATIAAGLLVLAAPLAARAGAPAALPFRAQQQDSTHHKPLTPRQVGKNVAAETKRVARRTDKTVTTAAGDTKRQAHRTRKQVHRLAKKQREAAKDTTSHP